MAPNRSMIAICAMALVGCDAFPSPPPQSSQRAISSRPSPLGAAPATESEKRIAGGTDFEEEALDRAHAEFADEREKTGYVPKWKKKATLAEGVGGVSDKEKGLAGAIPITFRQGAGESATLVETSAMPGQPLKLVASQAGQYIKYGCGKGECGTCEALCNGRYLRPCVDVVPTDLEPDAATGEYPALVIQVKGTKARVVSSGKFYSARSFVMGFWNNFLGMFGFVRDRRIARRNWQERMEKEDLIKQLTEEKRRKRREAAARKDAQ